MKDSHGEQANFLCYPVILCYPKMTGINNSFFLNVLETWAELHFTEKPQILLTQLLVIRLSGTISASDYKRMEVFLL